MIATGGKLYEKCYDCGRYVRISGFFGGLHVCAPPEQRRSYLESQRYANQQIQGQKTVSPAMQELISKLKSLQ